jgi:hypothetical protein
LLGADRLQQHRDRDDGQRTGARRARSSRSGVLLTNAASAIKPLPTAAAFEVAEDWSRAQRRRQEDRLRDHRQRRRAGARSGETAAATVHMIRINNATVIAHLYAAACAESLTRRDVRRPSPVVQATCHASNSVLPDKVANDYTPFVLGREDYRSFSTRCTTCRH